MMTKEDKYKFGFWLFSRMGLLVLVATFLITKLSFIGNLITLWFALFTSIAVLGMAVAVVGIAIIIYNASRSELAESCQEILDSIKKSQLILYDLPIGIIGTTLFAGFGWWVTMLLAFVGFVIPTFFYAVLAASLEWLLKECKEQ
jgi:hypothetical protein